MKALKKFKDIHFGWKHILIIFLILIMFHVFVAHLQQNTLRDLLSDTMDWYKQNSAEQIGNLTTSALELILETDPIESETDKINRVKNLIHALNSILKQPLMRRNVEAMCVILPYNNHFIALDLGQELYNYFYNHQVLDTTVSDKYKEAIIKYSSLHNKMVKSELITSFQEEQNLFHVFIPLVPYGEYSGAVYLRVRPDVNFISQQILSSFNKTVLIFSSLILIGLLGMFYISTYTIIERDEAREMLYREREEHLQKLIAQQKEHLFTKRIYHTHHKAEKVMGFIIEDIESADEKNIKEIKYRISKYANFISRVIYDMKWYSPPIQTIRNSIYKTNLNELIRFVVNNIFLRISNPVKTININLNLDENLPTIYVNEFVVWEIIEPLIQNSIDHSGTDIINVLISTKYDSENNLTILNIEDTGKGINESLLEKNEQGIKKIFLENVSTKEEGRNCGYGCYIAYEMAKRCGWELDVENKPEGGCKFILMIRHT
ncbi:sensor histidine kinase [Rosettibacter firmus]|uniref:sensor histidine kinase n=1 Tax=Rosettibacter firmus TaxID=3111522 RepID=UPI00336C1269